MAYRRNRHSSNRKSSNRRSQRKVQHNNNTVFEPLKGPHYTKQDGVTDFLDEDDPIPGQDLFLIAYLTMGEEQRKDVMEHIAEKTHKDYTIVKEIVTEWIHIEHPKRAVKMRGVWPNTAAARAEMKKKIDYYRSMKEDWHTFCGEVGKWCPFDPDPDMVDKIEGQDYYEQELNDLMKGKRLSQAKSKQMFEKRKREMMQKAIFEGTPEGQKMLMEEEEPIEVVEHRIKASEEAQKELKEKMAEAERVKKLAEEKLAYMKEQIAKGKKYPSFEEKQEQLRKQNFPSIEEIDNIEVDEEKIKEIQRTRDERRSAEQQQAVEKIRSIEKSRVDPTIKQQQKPKSAFDTTVENTFEKPPILPHERRQELAEEDEDHLLMNRFRKMLQDNPEMKEALLQDIKNDDTSPTTPKNNNNNNVKVL